MKPVSLLQVIFLSGAALILMGMGSCTRTVAGVCSQELPQFKAELQQVLVVEPGRQLASAAQENSWDLWAEAHLKEIQYWMDAIEPYPELIPLRRKLNNIADEMVIFHGYSQRADRTRMHSSIQKMSDEVEVVQRSLCSEKR